MSGDIRQQLLVALVQKLSCHSRRLVDGTGLHGSGDGRTKGLFGTEGWVWALQVSPYPWLWGPWCSEAAAVTAHCCQHMATACTLCLDLPGWLPN